jgi:tRNA(Arg) A34 adenosine deaminase TadA
MIKRELVVKLPGWVGDILEKRGHVLQGYEERMRLVIELAKLNVEYKTGGPFGAAIFEQESGRLVSVGVNLVESTKCSVAHAEIVAMGLAQRAVRSYDLGAEGLPAHELVTSTEPCAMCLGAVVWSGVWRVVCGAKSEDAIEVGFDEGDKPADWVGTLQKRGIRVVRDVLREEARAVLLRYKETGGHIYNARRETDI